MAQQKRIVAGILGCLLACSQPAGMMVMAAGTADPSAEMVGQSLYTDGTDLAGGLEPDLNDPDYVKRFMQQEYETEEDAALQHSFRSVSAKTTKSPFTGLMYTHALQLSDSNIMHGIDVSKWQADIDWAKVKAAGVKYVFIRCGYTALADKFAMYEDPYFRQNIQGAYNAGIKVGIYYFSNSKTVSEARKEALKTLELLEGYEDMITLPVVYDYEAFSNAYRAYGTSKAQVTKNTLAYIAEIEGAGFTPMYYGSPSFLDSSFDVSQLTEYDCWLANYTTKTSYTGDYTYWQYSSTGQVDGIAGNVDCNFYYSGPDDDVIWDDEDTEQVLEPVSGFRMEDSTTSSITVAWDPVEGASGYKLFRSKSLGGTYKQIKLINENTATTYEDTTVSESEGRQYYYKVVPFVLEDTVMKYGPESEVLTAYTEYVYKRRLKVQTSMNLRAEAGTEYASLAVVPAGTGLAFNKYALSTEDKKWYYVTYKQNGQSLKGYLSSSYVKTFTFGKTTRQMKMRSGAGTTYKALRSVPKGTEVKILSNKTDRAGTKWSRVRYTLNGKSYTGYIKNKFMKQM